MVYFGLLISSYISENELIHVFNCFEINSVTVHKKWISQRFRSKNSFYITSLDWKHFWLETMQFLGKNPRFKNRVNFEQLLLIK